jgi:hypothetical protein
MPEADAIGFELLARVGLKFTGQEQPSVPSERHKSVRRDCAG